MRFAILFSFSREANSLGWKGNPNFARLRSCAAMRCVIDTHIRAGDSRLFGTALFSFLECSSGSFCWAKVFQRLPLVCWCFADSPVLQCGSYSQRSNYKQNQPMAEPTAMETNDGAAGSSKSPLLGLNVGGLVADLSNEVSKTALPQPQKRRSGSPFI